MPASRINRATRLWLTVMPRPRDSSVCTRGHPYVPRESSWIVSMCLSSISFSSVRADFTPDRHS